MQRRTFLLASAAAVLSRRLVATFADRDFDSAAAVLREATASRQVMAASMHVVHRGRTTSLAFGTAASPEAMFLLGSISKPIAMAALMTLYDAGEFQLEDRVSRFIPEFVGDGREQVTLRQLLTHTGGLPDQLPENNRLRADHAPLPEFVSHAVRTPLLFAPGSQYQYASMGMLLAAHVAERISGVEIREFVQSRVFTRLGMRHSAQGLGVFQLHDFVPCQTEHAAPESGAGDPGAKNWDWNSAYWRALGAPWGGTHASAADIGRFLAEFLTGAGTLLKPDTARLMVTNANPAGLTPRGLGFQVGVVGNLEGCSNRTFGHTGSTGTIAWADPATETLCVVLTSLPGRAVSLHPRDVAAQQIADSVRAE